MFFMTDAAPQPRFYSILTQEASEDDLHRLDTEVRTWLPSCGTSHTWHNLTLSYLCRCVKSSSPECWSTMTCTLPSFRYWPLDPSLTQCGGMRTKASQPWWERGQQGLESRDLPFLSHKIMSLSSSGGLCPPVSFPYTVEDSGNFTALQTLHEAAVPECLRA